jgi:hypothetical protein
MKWAARIQRETDHEDNDIKDRPPGYTGMLSWLRDGDGDLPGWSPFDQLKGQQNNRRLGRVEDGKQVKGEGPG